ncbi:MAG: T9SS type A sorting domain-containing protein [Chitinophagaceae bacterium]
MRKFFTLSLSVPFMQRVAFTFLFLLFVSLSHAVDYYSKATGNANSTATWGINLDGTGTAPSNFITSGDRFFLRSASNLNLSSNWTIGAGVTLQVDGILNINGNNNDVLINGIIMFPNISSPRITQAGSGNGNEFTLNSNATLKTADIDGISCATCPLPVSAFKKEVNLNQNANYEFNGSANQATTGLPATNKNFTINSTGIITLNQATTVTGTLTLTNGILSTSSTNLLTLTDGATVVRTNPNDITTAFVNGPVRKIGNDAFIFPVGKTNSGYHPISISAPTSLTDEFTAEYLRPNAYANAPITAKGLTSVSPCEYWTLNGTTTSNSAVDVTLFYNELSSCGGGIQSDVVARYNGTNWYDFRASSVTGELGVNGSVTWNSVTDFTAENGVFTLGASGVNAPLPVKFISFDAKAEGSGNKLTWKVADQIDVLRYEVERSSNGNQFTKIGEVPAADVTTYTFTDRQPAQGAVFYRIKNVDVDGKFKYSTIVSIRNGQAAIVLKAFPLPAKNNITLQHAAAGAKSIIRLNAQDGRTLQTIRPAAGTMQTGIDLSALAPGLYLLSFDGGNGTVETLKVVKQ